MKKHERLFLAIGAADEDLLRRSEEAGKRRRLRRWGTALTAAACLALILTALLPQLADGGDVVPPSPSGPPRAKGGGNVRGERESCPAASA